MNEHDLLMERYEDALFALLMEEVAVSEGKKALLEQEALQHDPDYAVPEAVSQRCKKVIEREFRRQSAHRSGRAAYKLLNRVAVAALFGVFLMTAAFAAIPEFRVNTLNTMIEVYEKGTGLRFRPEPGPAEGHSLEAGWLPDGYTLQTQTSDSFTVRNVYTNAGGGFIDASIIAGENGGMLVDTEDADVKHMEIQGWTAMVICKEGSVQIVWGDEERVMFVVLITETASESDMIRVAENLIIK